MHSVNLLELNRLNVSIISCVYVFIFTLPKGEIVNIWFCCCFGFFRFDFGFGCGFGFHLAKLCAHLIWNGKTVTISQLWMHNKLKNKEDLLLIRFVNSFCQSAIGNCTIILNIISMWKYYANIEHWTLNTERSTSNNIIQ